MTTFTEMVAVVVLHSSAAAYSHFGVALEPVRVEHPTPAAERVVARTPRAAEKLNACPAQQHETRSQPIRA